MRLLIIANFSLVLSLVLFGRTNCFGWNAEIRTNCAEAVGAETVDSVLGTADGSSGAGTGMGGSEGEGVSEQSSLPFPGQIPPTSGPQTPFCFLHGPEVPGKQSVQSVIVGDVLESSLQILN